MTNPFKTLASGWISHAQLLGTPRMDEIDDAERERLEAASMELIFLVDEDHTAALEMIEEILAQTSDPAVLGQLGAGAIEGLLKRNATETVTRLDELAKKYPGVTLALSHVWASREFSAEALALLDRHRPD